MPVKIGLSMLGITTEIPLSNHTTGQQASPGYFHKHNSMLCPFLGWVDIIFQVRAAHHMFGHNMHLLIPLLSHYYVGVISSSFLCFDRSRRLLPLE